MSSQLVSMPRTTRGSSSVREPQEADALRGFEEEEEEEAVEKKGLKGRGRKRVGFLSEEEVAKALAP